MKSQTILKIIEHYREELEDWLGYKPKRFDEFDGAPSYDEQLEHVLWMIHEIPVLIEKQQQESYTRDYNKINRWLGFIQGIMWANGFYNIAFLKKQNSGE